MQKTVIAEFMELVGPFGPSEAPLERTRLIARLAAETLLALPALFKGHPDKYVMQCLAAAMVYCYMLGRRDVCAESS